MRSRTTARKRPEEALRESEPRQAFLVRPGDAIRDLKEPARVQAEAGRAIGEYLRVRAGTYGLEDFSDGAIAAMRRVTR